MRTAFIETLVSLAENDPDIWLLNADLGFSVLEAFRDRFPDRYVNVGVAEQNMIGVAAGLALSGCKVFVYSIANFPTQRCLEQLRVDVCYHRAHVVVCAVGGGFSYGAQGYTHHAIEDLSVMRSLPGMTVTAPSDPTEVRALVKHLVANDGPGYIRLGRAGDKILHDGTLAVMPTAPFVMRDGRDVAIITTGSILGEALAATTRLAEAGVSSRIISAPMLKPFAETMFCDLVTDFDVVISVEEHALIGGLRDTLAPLFASRRVPGRLVSLGVGDMATFGVIKGEQAMRRHCGIDADSIVQTVRRELGC
ncbi:MAG: transketolase [Pseudonocardiaceae bacterium]|nr:MAG: transketolase [Pseudonocardiaceae bacterium]